MLAGDLGNVLWVRQELFSDDLPSQSALFTLDVLQVLKVHGFGVLLKLFDQENQACGRSQLFRVCGAIESLEPLIRKHTWAAKPGDQCCDETLCLHTLTPTGHL